MGGSQTSAIEEIMARALDCLGPVAGCQSARFGRYVQCNLGGFGGGICSVASASVYFEFSSP